MTKLYKADSDQKYSQLAFSYDLSLNKFILLFAA